MSEQVKWKIDDAEESPLAVVEDTEDGMGVCEIGKPGSRRADASPEEWKQACLIAAAPTFLEACEDAKRRLETIGVLLNGSPSSAEIHAAYDTAYSGMQRAAIAAAKEVAG